METGKSSIRREAEGGFYTGYSSPGHDFDFGRFKRDVRIHPRKRC